MVLGRKQGVPARRRVATVSPGGHGARKRSSSSIVVAASVAILLLIPHSALAARDGYGPPYDTSWTYAPYNTPAPVALCAADVSGTLAGEVQVSGAHESQMCALTVGASERNRTAGLKTITATVHVNSATVERGVGAWDANVYTCIRAPMVDHGKAKCEYVAGLPSLHTSRASEDITVGLQADVPRNFELEVLVQTVLVVQSSDVASASRVSFDAVVTDISVR